MPNIRVFGQNYMFIPLLNFLDNSVCKNMFILVSPISNKITLSTSNNLTFELSPYEYLYKKKY